MKRSRLLILVAALLALVFAFSQTAMAEEVTACATGTFAAQEEAAIQAKGVSAKQTTKIRAVPSKKTLYLGDTFELQCKVWYPVYSSPDSVYVENLSPSVIDVEIVSGRCYVTGIATGKGKIRLTSGKKKCTMKVTVKRPPVQSTYIFGSSYRTLNMSTTVGSKGVLYLSAYTLPSNALQTVTWKSSNKKVATVSSSGVVTAVKPGSCTITATSKSGKKKASVTVNVVDPVRRRAIVLIEASATNGSYSSYSAQTAEYKQGINEQNQDPRMFTRNGIEVVSTIYNDYSAKTSLQNAINSVASQADSDDVTFVYIHAHGNNAYGQHYMAIAPNASSGSGNSRYLFSSELKTMLDKVPGRKVLLIESCHSGTMVGKGTTVSANAESRAFAEGFVEAFKEEEASSFKAKSGEMRASNYYVICAASGNQVSWGLYGPSFKSGLFTYSAGKALGWEINKGKKLSSYAADGKNGGVKDGALTQMEIFRYASSNVNTLIRKYRIPETQTVVCYPEDNYYALVRNP